MKKELSSMELHFMIKELQDLISAKVEQIYQIAKQELILQLHCPGKGKHILRIVLGKLIYLASNKGGVPEKPPGFCLHLRKRLKNARLRSLDQIGSERIVVFLFETKEAKHKLIIELFSKGNIILCSEDDKIISVLERQEWKDRSIRPGQQYSFPKSEYGFLDLTDDAMTSLLHGSDKENLVKTLAIDLGLGGTYAEELCLRAGVDKRLKSNQLSGKETSSLHDALKNLLGEKMMPSVVYTSEKKADVKDIVPVELMFYKDAPKDPAESFNKALDSVLTEKHHEKAMDTAEKSADTRIDKVNEMIRQQEQRIAGLEKSEKENQRKGEVIYENYALVDQALLKLKELKETMSWKEIKEHFKGHKIIKSVDEKTGEVTLEI